MSVENYFTKENLDRYFRALAREPERKIRL